MKDCELLRFYRFLGKKWAFPLLSNISPKPISFNELANLSHHIINPTLLSSRLKDMIQFQLIKKQKIDGKIVYILTPPGERMKKLLYQIKEWGQEQEMDIPHLCRNKECVCSQPFQVKAGKEVASIH